MRISDLFHKKPDFSDRPWINSAALSFLEGYLASRPCDVLDLGAGGSTSWFSARANSLVSIEHDPAWHEKIARETGDLDNVDLRLCSRPYFHRIDEFPEAVFDLVFIDGRDRVECARHSLRVLRSPGAIFVDDTWRIDNTKAPYRDLPSVFPEGWRRIDLNPSIDDRRARKGRATVWLAPGKAEPGGSTPG